MGFVQGGKLMDTVDAVARAIAEEADDYYWDLLSPEEREPYYKRARAAIDAHTDALGLTEETDNVPVVVGRVEHTQPCELPDQMIGGEEMHTCGFRRGHFEFHPSTRLVSGWVRKDNTNE